MKDPLGLSPSNGNQGTTRGKEKIPLTSVGIEPTTSGLDLPLLCRLSYEVGQRNVPDFLCPWVFHGLLIALKFTLQIQNSLFHHLMDIKSITVLNNTS